MCNQRATILCCESDIPVVHANQMPGPRQSAVVLQQPSFLERRWRWATLVHLG